MRFWYSQGLDQRVMIIVMLGNFFKYFTRTFWVIIDNSIEHNMVYCVSNYNIYKREVNYKAQKK